MNSILWIVLITGISGIGGTGLGGLIAAVIRKNSTKIVSLLLSFAGGVMTSVVCFDLIPEAVLPDEASGSVNIFIVIIGILFGYGIIYLLNYLIDKNTNHEIDHIDEQHPSTADELDELIHSDHYQHHKNENSKYQLFIAGLVMAFAIALHNLPEGMVIGAAYAADSNTSFSGSSIVLAIVIGLHNIPEGMAVSVPLIAGGMSRLKAICVTSLSGAPTIIGALIGYYIGMLSPLALSLALSFASGAMLYVVLGELLPEAILMWRSKMPAFAILVGLLVGMIIIFA